MFIKKIHTWFEKLQTNAILLRFTTILQNQIRKYRLYSEPCLNLIQNKTKAFRKEDNILTLYKNCIVIKFYICVCAN